MNFRQTQSASLLSLFILKDTQKKTNEYKSNLLRKLQYIFESQNCLLVIYFSLFEKHYHMANLTAFMS